MTSQNDLRSRLHEPGPLFFGLMTIPDPAVAAVLGSSGIDLVILDAEHGPYTPSSLRACAKALKATPADTAVRTASADAAEIRQVVDLGIGVIVPHIESAEEAEAVVAAARRSPDSSIAVMVIIESRRGVENAAEIAAVDGLDGLIVGPGDLSADLGVNGQFDHESVREGIDDVVACALEVGLKVSAWREPRSAAERDSLLVFTFVDKSALQGAVRAAFEQERTVVLGVGATGEHLQTGVVASS
jgi:4-hydroxy-2-oxoheptanedioate aldolase